MGKSKNRKNRNIKRGGTKQGGEQANHVNQDQEIDNATVSQLPQEVSAISLEENSQQKQQQTPVEQSSSTQQEPMEQPLSTQQEPMKQPSHSIGKLKNVKEEKELPGRPSFGKAGKEIQLKGNFFKLTFLTNAPSIIYQYHVSIKPVLKKSSEGDKEIKDSGQTEEVKTEKEVSEDQPYKMTCAKGRKIFEKMIKDNAKSFNIRPVFDGKALMYSKDKVKINDDHFPVKITNGRGKDRKYQVTLTRTDQEVEFQGMSKESITGLNLVLRHNSTLKYIPVGSKFFMKDNPVEINEVKNIKVMLRGFAMSVRPTYFGLMLNVDVSASAFYREMEVLAFLHHTTGYDPKKYLKDRQRNDFESEIKGLMIKVTHLQKERTYKVQGVTRESDDRLTFKKKDGTKITVRDYFKQAWNITLRNPLPCLIVKSGKDEIYYPLQVCRLAENQHCRDSKLTKTDKKNLVAEASQNPNDRKDAINKILVEKLNPRENEYATSMGVQVENKMAEVKGRIIDPPKILYAGNQKPFVPREGKWNMIKRKVLEGATIKAWGLVNCCQMGKDDIKNFEEKLVEMAGWMGIGMENCVGPLDFSIHDSPEDVVTQAFMEANNERLNLLVVILPNTRPNAKQIPFYGKLKQLCETENGYQSIQKEGDVKEFLKKNGLPTQCVQKKNASKCNPMCLAQLLLKINAKMGGTNNAVEDSVFNEPVLFMGADVTHPGRETGSSIAAVVGSVDEIPSRYAVSVRVQRGRLEIIDFEEMKEITTKLLNEYKSATKKTPQKIIMFRDGVSEGEFQQVLYNEKRGIKEACKAFEEGYKPKITFILVQKRHHARFFTMRKEDADESGNCYPGTTIDSGVCHLSEYDYYQYGHSGIKEIKATTCPAHYHVLYDKNKFEPDELQALSFMLCHLYARSTRSVSLPAPVYYAHLVACRAKVHLKEKLDDSISESSSTSGFIPTLEELAEIAKPHPQLMKQMYFV